MGIFPKYGWKLKIFELPPPSKPLIETANIKQQLVMDWNFQNIGSYTSYIVQDWTAINNTWHKQQKTSQTSMNMVSFSVKV